MNGSHSTENILVKYLFWYFFDIPKEILRGWRNFLMFNLNYFSVFLLLKTFFSHWRRYQWSYGRGFDISKYLEAFFSNLISRIIGAIMRSVLIIFGILTELLILIIGMIIFVGWFLTPVFIFGGLYFGITLLIS
jgi:hypothetical protein